MQRGGYGAVNAVRWLWCGGYGAVVMARWLWCGGYGAVVTVCRLRHGIINVQILRHSFPSGENATDQTELVCPCRGLPTGAPVCASQICSVLSVEPDTIYLPSGENTAEKVMPVCP